MHQLFAGSVPTLSLSLSLSPSPSLHLPLYRAPSPLPPLFLVVSPATVKRLL